MPTYNTDREAVMSAEQNAHVIVNAERYYRAMVRQGAESWNIRDRHMVDTLNRLMKFYGRNAKAIVWEHNTHIGDARATDMTREGMVNVGQLVNEQHSKDGVYAIGFGSYKGSVIAGHEWGDVMRVMNIPEARIDSWEYLLHQLGKKNRIVFMNEEMKSQIGKQAILHRAIGVVCSPMSGQYGIYVPSYMPYRYDAFMFIDETRALHPLHIEPDGNQMPETFPFGL
jgi:erythromycin esterase